MLPGDRPIVDTLEGNLLYKSFLQYCHGSLLRKKDGRLHLGLIPMPYLGNLKEESVFLLQLNPGLHPLDYLFEYERPECKEALLRNLRQSHDADFLWLDPRLAWHPGWTYWFPRFRGIAEELAPTAGSFTKALTLLRKTVACLELVPYHSQDFAVPPKAVEQLESTRLVKQFVKGTLEPRARQRDVLIVVLRGKKRWNVQERKNVFEGVPRGGFFGPNTQAAKEIVKFLRSTVLGRA